MFAATLILLTRSYCHSHNPQAKEKPMFETLTALTLGVLIAVLLVAVVISQLAVFYGGTVAALATIGLIIFTAWAVREVRND